MLMITYVDPKDSRSTLISPEKLTERVILELIRLLGASNDGHSVPSRRL